MNRRDEVFHVLKVIGWHLEQMHGLTVRVIRDTAADRARAEEWARTREDPVASLQALHTLCRQLIDEREVLAQELERIERDLDHANIPLRRRNLGAAASGTAEAE